MAVADEEDGPGGAGGDDPVEGALEFRLARSRAAGCGGRPRRHRHDGCEHERGQRALGVRPLRDNTSLVGWSNVC